MSFLLTLAFPAFALTFTDIHTPDAVTSLEAAGDLDADGYDDVLLTVMTGVYLASGGPSGIDTTNAMEFGSWYLSFPLDAQDRAFPIGDFDGDGYDDVAVTNHAYKGIGALLLYRGSASGPPANPWVVLTAYGNPGAVARMGDLDGDGVADILGIDLQMSLVRIDL